MLQTVTLDITQTTFGSYISDETFEGKLETALGVDDTVTVEVLSSTDTASTLTVVYNINIFTNATETVDTLTTLQDQIYKDAVAGTTELLLGGAIYHMCYDDCVGTYVIWVGAETVAFTGNSGFGTTSGFGSVRRLSGMEDVWLSPESLCLFDIEV